MRQAQWSETGLSDLAKQIRKRLKNNYDCIGAITGYEGTGKSNLAIQLAMLVDNKFDTERNIILGTNFSKIKEKIENLPNGSATIFDEGVKQWHKGDWSGKVQKSLIKYSTVFRKENKLHLICIPHFNDLTKAFRQRRIFFWIHVLERGTAVLMKSLDKSPMVSWYLDDLDKLFKKSVEMRKMNVWSLQDNMAILSRSVHYMNTFPFKQLPKEIEDKYLEYVKVHGVEGIDEEEDESHVDRYKGMMILFGHLLDLIKTGKITKPMTVKRIARMVNEPARKLQRWRKDYIDSVSSREVHTTFTSSRNVHVNKTDAILNVDNER